MTDESKMPDLDELVEMTEVPPKMVLHLSLQALAGQTLVITGGRNSGRSNLLELVRAYCSVGSASAISASRRGRLELLSLLQGDVDGPEDLVELPGGLTCTISELAEAIAEVEGGRGGQD